MRYFFPLTLISILAPAAAAAAEGSKPMLASSKAFYDQIKGLILKSADKLPEGTYSFRPTRSISCAAL